MKSCATCFRVYANDASFCASDGSPLVLSESIRPQSTDPRVGKVVAGRYDLQRKVADGAMGRVYEAIDKQLDAQVAVKVLHPEVAKDRVAVARFRREFEVSTALAHPHVVAMRDYIPIGDLSEPAIVMDYLEGRDLGGLLQKDHTIRYGRLIRILAQAASALDDAHAQGYVHRDLKPENILLCGTPEGDDVKLLDFGSVRDNSAPSVDLRRLTAFGTTIGSPYYMAPEQAEGKAEIDGRADVYALAVIAYECISGKVPFDGGTPMEILMAALSSPARSLLDSDMTQKPPRAFDAALQRGLAKRPEYRQETSAQLVTELGRALGLEGVPADWASTRADELEKTIQQRAKWAASAELDPFAAPPPGASQPATDILVPLADARPQTLLLMPVYGDDNAVPAEAPSTARAIGSMAKGGLLAAGMRGAHTPAPVVPSAASARADDASDEGVPATVSSRPAPDARLPAMTTYQLPVTKVWSPLRVAVVLFVLAAALIGWALTRR